MNSKALQKLQEINFKTITKVIIKANLEKEK
mgnify:CR=1 FL=1